jgi:hypothetical protein
MSLSQRPIAETKMAIAAHMLHVQCRQALTAGFQCCSARSVALQLHSLPGAAVGAPATARGLRQARAVSTGSKKRRNSINSSSNGGGGNVGGLRRKNPVQSACLSAMPANCAVSATGISVGASVSRRCRVPATASTNVERSKGKVRAVTQMSWKSLIRPLASPKRIIASNFSATTVSGGYIKTSAAGRSGNRLEKFFRLGAG